MKQDQVDMVVTRVLAKSNTGSEVYGAIYPRKRNENQHMAPEKPYLKEALRAAVGSTLSNTAFPYDD